MLRTQRGNRQPDTSSDLYEAVGDLRVGCAHVQQRFRAGPLGAVKALISKADANLDRLFRLFEPIRGRVCRDVAPARMSDRIIKRKLRMDEIIPQLEQLSEPADLLSANLTV